ncbi:serine hydrolase [Mesorhizobium sp. LNJC391B00]|uniref:serine hydrolase domain-containing protein n=1 Tax=Mesorhizobium sp. LNJC391B00 TaxID=1287273 RepID=UPI0003CDDDA2|nr:serine hydrolase [Mesorhizobium sp. LNJC391B00]ESY28921.1 beta-lactamase [Mesorhizobium sp. LNJC391B00]
MSQTNPDLTVNPLGQSRWNYPDYRRHGFHNLHRIARYGLSFRAARVMELQKRMDIRIAEMDSVHRLTSLPWFSAMAVVRGTELLFERYASDFGPDRPHSIMSVSKTLMNLVIGRLLEDRKIELDQKVAHYLPWIGSGYASATVQQVLNMDVANDYSEDLSDLRSTTYAHEEAGGLRLPATPENEHTMRSFLATISSSDTVNRTGFADYKTSNTDVLSMIAEAASGRSMRSYLADIADATGIEGCLHITADREGFPNIGCGVCVTARDLARYGSLFVRRGKGMEDRQVGSASFIERSLVGGIPMSAPRDWLRYSNQTNTDGRWLGHGGFGGQYMIADLVSGVVGVFFSVVENREGNDSNYHVRVIEMLQDIGRLDF